MKYVVNSSLANMEKNNSQEIVEMTFEEYLNRRTRLMMANSLVVVVVSD